MRVRLLVYGNVDGVNQEEGTTAHKQGGSWLFEFRLKGGESIRCGLHGHRNEDLDGLLE